MMDGRRHSVDIPISRTLIALRRVRSLRDPSTNSMSKFSASLESVNWETSSANEISLQLVNGHKEGISDANGIPQFKTSGLGGERKERDDGLELESHLGKSMLKLIRKSEGCDSCGSNKDETHRSNHSDEGLNFACISPSMEGADSATEPNIRSPQANSMDQSLYRSKNPYKNHLKSPRMVGDVLSRAGSPSMSISEAFSSHSTSLFANEEADFRVQNDQGCGISCCWTRTPRFRELTAYSDVEGRPLLLRDVANSTPHGHRNWKQICNRNPRSLSEKFGPKSFNELVGQSVVARSLLGAITTGRITSFYLFHGPRGTGKTSASRIFAAALNCLSEEDHMPCGHCKECVQFFSGRGGDVKEVDSVKINRAERIRSLIRNASNPSTSSRFKVFIVDDCHLLHEETWATLLNSMDNFSRYVVFLMITPDLDKLPRSAVSRSQRLHFTKIKDTDIARRLENICLEEGLAFDEGSLDFIASKANGSLRDAEMMLDQLSLLGKRITMSLANELIGVVSDDELLDLLDLALSSDTSNTVIRARELMKSRIDPMQLVSQLANLIMDILAGECQDTTEERRKFSRRHASEADKQRLSHALKVLSETEKQLRVAKNQSTWLTVALLQLSSSDSSSLDANDSKLSLRNSHDRDGDLCSTSSTGESLKRPVGCTCEHGKMHKSEIQGDRTETLESIWKRATELCQSDSFKSFLRMQGKLSSLFIIQDLAIAELEFHHPDYVSKAEKSWKLIANSLQSVLGRNVEIRINLVPTATALKCAKLRKVSFGLFNCSGRMQPKSQSSMECLSDSDSSDCISEKLMVRDKAILPHSSDCGSQVSHDCCQKEQLGKAFRNSEGNVLSIGTTISHRSSQNVSSMTTCHGINSPKDVGENIGDKVLSGQETEEQPYCFPRSLRLPKRLHSSNNSQAICIGNEQENKFSTSLHMAKSFETDSYVFSSNNYSNSRSEDGFREDSAALRWRTPSFPSSKAWELTNQRRRSPLVGWVLPCSAAK